MSTHEPETGLTERKAMTPARWNPIRITILVVGIYMFGGFLIATGAMAGPRVQINVKTILASNGKRFVDPSLSPPLIQELTSVFRYTSYRLISGSQMNLQVGQTGRARLAGKRSLQVTPLGIKGNRARLRLEIYNHKRQMFQTEIQLRNRSSIIVGGPRHQNGVLLFKVSNRF